MKNYKVQLLSAGALILLAGCGNQPEKPADTTQSAVDTSTQTSPDTTTDSSAVTSGEQNTEESLGIEKREFGYTLTQAIETFNETFKNASIESISLRERDKEFVYKFEGFDTNMEYTLILNAETGEVVSEDQDEDDIDDRKAIDTEAILSPQEAMEKALTDTPAGTYIEDWELERHNDQTVYDLDVKYPSGSPGEDLEVDAQTGEVIIDNNVD